MENADSLRAKIDTNAVITFLTFDDKKGREVYWHSTSHLMAHAILSLYPEAKFGVGPAIENGFCYDFDINKKYIKSYKHIKVPQSTTVPWNFQPKTKFINESGLYQLLSKSTKPLAKKFMEKYFIDIMPEIRKSGQ